MREMNQALTERVLAELRNVIRDLGRDGGSMTPSVYETAQVLRFCPEIVEADKVVDWLLRQQQPDGGWGEVEAPLYRTVPTLAAILALHDYSSHERVRHACFLGQRFLEEQDTVIKPADGEYLPVAIELILPRLLEEADERGIFLSRTRFRHLEELGDRKRKLLALHPPAPNSAAMFSWEAWGTEPDLELVTCTGVSHSPAATAWWLHLSGDRAAGRDADAKARNYIIRASLAAGSGICGLVPNAWPMNRFEQSFVLYTLLNAGLLSHRRLADVVMPQLTDLRLGLKAGGLGHSDYFMADGDDTAAAVAALAGAGMQVDCGVLSPFERDQHFVAYPFETHSSFTVTARATQALALAGRDVSHWRSSVAQAQLPDGWWASDKWNCSRLYGTSVALAALDGSANAAKADAVNAFVNNQHNDGGWGCFGQSTLVETAFGVLALCNIAQDNLDGLMCHEAISAAHGYLYQQYETQRIGTEHTWICKDLYSATRVDQATILCALLAPYRLARNSSQKNRQLQSSRKCMTTQ